MSQPTMNNVHVPVPINQKNKNVRQKIKEVKEMIRKINMNHDENGRFSSVPSNSESEKYTSDKQKLQQIESSRQRSSKNKIRGYRGSAL